MLPTVYPVGLARTDNEIALTNYLTNIIMRSFLVIFSLVNAVHFRNKQIWQSKVKTVVLIFKIL